MLSWLVLISQTFECVHFIRLRDLNSELNSNIVSQANSVLGGSFYEADNEDIRVFINIEPGEDNSDVWDDIEVCF